MKHILTIFVALFWIGCGSDISTDFSSLTSLDPLPNPAPQNPGLAPIPNLPPLNQSIPDFSDSSPSKLKSDSSQSPYTTAIEKLFMETTGFSAGQIRRLYQGGLLDRWIRPLHKDLLVLQPKTLFPNLFVNNKTIKCSWCKAIFFNPSTATQALTGAGVGPFATGGSGTNSATVFDPEQNRFIIVWDEPSGEDTSQIFAKIINSDGFAVTGLERIQISPATRPREGCLYAGFSTDRPGVTVPRNCNYHYDPAVAYDNGTYFIVWSSRMTGSASATDHAVFSVTLGKMLDATTLQPLADPRINNQPRWGEALLLSRIHIASNNPNSAPTRDEEVMAWSNHFRPAVAALPGENAFFLVEENNRDYVVCNDRRGRSGKSIYGRVIPTDFGPGTPNKRPFSIFTDPSASEVHCGYDEDVTSGRNPAVTYNQTNHTFFVAFETAKSVEGLKPSIHVRPVRFNTNLDAEPFNATILGDPAFALVDQQGGYNPDLVASENGFVLVHDIDRKNLIQHRFGLSNGNISRSAPSQTLSDADRDCSQPKIVFTQPTPASPQEFVLGFQKKFRSGKTTVELTSLNTDLTEIKNEEGAPVRVVLDRNAVGLPTETNRNPSLAAGIRHVMTSWFAAQPIGTDSGEITFYLAEVEAMHVVDGNQKPTAVIRFSTGSENVYPADVVTLHGEDSSDPEDGQTITYEWQSVGDTEVVLRTRVGPRTDFTAPDVAEGEEKHIAIQLRVFDRDRPESPRKASDPVVQNITVRRRPPPNQQPTARIRRVNPTQSTMPETDPNTHERTRVRLSAVDSTDPDENTLNFHWEQREINADRSNEIIGVTTGEHGEFFEFDAPNATWERQNLTVKINLTANDGFVNSSPALETLTIQFVNQPPLVSLGPDLVFNEGETVTLTAILADPDGGQPISLVGWGREDAEPYPFLWEELSGNRIRFELPPSEVTRTIRFRATAQNDTDPGNIAFDELNLQVRDINHAPTAPELTSPSNDISMLPIRVRLEWNPSDDVDIVEGDQIDYSVYFGETNPPPLRQRDVTETFYTVSELLPNRTYYWRVRTEDAEGLFAESPVRQFRTDNSIIARWTFDEGMGGQARDVTGNGWDGNIDSPDGPHWLQNGNDFMGAVVEDVVGGALGFNGNDSVRVPNLTLSGAAEGAVELRVRIDSVGIQPQILSLRENAADPRHTIYIYVSNEDGSIVCEVDPWTSPEGGRTRPIPLHQMNHILCQFGPRGIEVFFNGVLDEVAPRPGTLPTYNGFLEMGHDSRFNCCNLDGMIDEVTLYNRTLTTEEIERSVSN